MSRVYEYRSGLAAPIQAFIAEKRALGLKYEKEGKIFWELDRFLIDHKIQTSELPRLIVEQWIEKRPNEKRKNQRYRLNFTKRFALYLQSKGYEAYCPLLTISTRDDYDFSPYIFTNEELGKILAFFDNMKPSNNYPGATLVFPLLFRTLVCCGMRAAEAANIRIKDVDFLKGVVLVREAKHDKKRLVPLSEPLWAEFIRYFEALHQSSDPEGYFFPNARGNPHHTNHIYDRFREALWHCGIQHKGRGYGPRVHDLRHTFAVRCMLKLQAAKGDIVTTLPYLSVYLGHYNMNKTQMYLRLIAEHYPEFIENQCEYLGETIPTWEGDYEN
jgi:integrase/recombinase XerD